MGLHVAACQLDSAWEDKGESCRRAERLLERARPPRGALVVLPEMFSTGFSMDVGATAEGSERTAEKFLAESARRLGACVLGGVVTREAPGSLAANQAVAFDADGAELARYAKIHPFSYAGEDRRFARGSGVVTFPWCGFVVAPFVCYDLRFPEVFRAAALSGATLLVVIANWPAPREAHWLALLSARAIENQAYVVGVNRCGRDPHVEYSGRSRIVDPRGRVIAEGGTDECVVSAELDLDALLAYRREFPVLADADPRFLPDRRR